MSDHDGLIDYGPHKLCTKHKSNIPVTAKCVYCELKDTAALDRADVLKMNKLEAEVRELRAKLEDSDYYLIVFDDAAVEPELVVGHDNANKLFEQRKDHWNCHLFKKVKDGVGRGHEQPTKGDGGE